MEYIARQTENLDWITILLISCFGIYALTRYFYPRRFKEFTLLPITNKYFLVEGRDTAIQHPFNVLLFASQIIAVSLLILLVFRVEAPQIAEGNRWLFVQICTGYAVFVLMKYYLEKITGAVFGIELLIDQYLYQKLTYRNLLGVFVFIFNIVLVYLIQPERNVLLIFLAFLVLTNGLTLFYSYKTAGNTIFRNFFYFILYLCALEISPYIILYKVIVHQGAF